ncbi:MAG TPA: polysaccharide deacetylase family protein [Planctomycetes bacterium]|nr:polysaccharide deacetylase family protein [Planctomycetaceae bacterium]HIM30549.1 polysaccharide deacetylase family protein [Planctomycetota bacterium]
MSGCSERRSKRSVGLHRAASAFAASHRCLDSTGQMTIDKLLMTNRIQPRSHRVRSTSAHQFHLPRIMSLPGTIVWPRSRVPLEPGQVMLSFDDGPNHHPGTTDRLLDVLEQAGVLASFCVVGRQAARRPDLVQRIFEQGHCLVNHSQTHPFPPPTSSARWLSEIDECDSVLANVLGQPDFRSSSFRPPYGILTPSIRRALRLRSMRVSPITYYAFDTYFSPANSSRVVERIVRNARNHGGGAYVLHDYRYRRRDSRRCAWPRSSANRSWVPDATRQIIERVTAMGFSFVSLDARL